MTAPKKIVWIDDNPDRRSTAAHLRARFYDVSGKELGKEIGKLLDGPMPGLVIIDHILDKTADANPVLLKGSTIAEAIKENWPSCPVIGVTNADQLKKIDIRTKGTYDDLFSFQDFGTYFDRIRGIVAGFALATRTGSDVAGLIKLLKPPNEETERLRDSLTDDLKVQRKDPSVASRLYDWVKRLMGRPGFLYDSQWAATFLGLNEGGFRKTSKLFVAARYKGVFARPTDDRWWSIGLSNRLYRLCGPQPGELSWHVGRRLPGINKKHFSSCYKCGGDYPETVAYLDEKIEECHAMHLKCTELHPRFQRELYFEDVRVMRGD